MQSADDLTLSGPSMVNLSQPAAKRNRAMTERSGATAFADSLDEVGETDGGKSAERLREGADKAEGVKIIF
jgi:hypothetical protein